TTNPLSCIDILPVDLCRRPATAIYRLGMEAALILIEPLPTAGAALLPRNRAVVAADALETAVKERVIGDLVVGDVLPGLRLGPVREGVDFDHVELRVPRHDRDLAAAVGLVPPKASDPRGLVL